MLDKGITQDELDLERADFLAGVIQQADFQMLLAIKYGNALVLGRPVEFIDDWLSAIKAVTVADVNAAARKYFLDDVKVTAEGWPSVEASAPAAGAGDVK